MPDNITDYAAYGKYCALQAQARAAAQRRFALLHNLGQDCRRAAECAQEPLEHERLTRALQEAAAAERALRQAVTDANAAAALCGQPELTLARFNPF